MPQLSASAQPPSDHPEHKKWTLVDEQKDNNKASAERVRSKRKYRKYTYKMLEYLSYVLPLGFVAWCIAQQTWFWYHPAAMVLAYIVIPPFSAKMKRAGGYSNTKNHGITMGISVALAIVGWYVIHSNKDAAGKDHITTWHGLLGWIN